MRRVLTWLGFVLLCNGAGFASAMFGTNPDLYTHLAKPSWAPPGWLFGPVWTALYTLMGTATYLVWRSTRGHARRTAMIAFAIQLVLNVSWTPVFFGLERFGLAAILILVVLASVTVMGIVYARRVRLAGILLIPLWVWVAFASALNIAIWSLATR